MHYVKNIFTEGELIDMAYDYVNLIGKEVRLDRGGPESRQGRVVAGGSDYVVIYNEKDGLIYYNTQHLKSITQNTKNSMEYSEVETELPSTMKIMEADNFAGLLRSMKNLWCQINRGGHESVQGVLSELNDDYINMVVNHELVTIFNYHIKSISYGVKKENQDNKKEENSNDKNSEKSNEKSNEESNEKSNEKGNDKGNEKGNEKGGKSNEKK